MRSFTVISRAAVFPTGFCATAEVWRRPLLKVDFVHFRQRHQSFNRSMQQSKFRGLIYGELCAPGNSFVL